MGDYVLTADFCGGNISDFTGYLTLDTIDKTCVSTKIDTLTIQNANDLFTTNGVAYGDYTDYQTTYTGLSTNLDWTIYTSPKEETNSKCEKYSVRHIDYFDQYDINRIHNLICKFGDRCNTITYFRKNNIRHINLF